jgi:hypothetical protein
MQSLEATTFGASDIWETEKPHCNSRPNQERGRCSFRAPDPEG